MKASYNCSPDVCRQLEHTEAQAWLSLYRSVPDTIADRLGVAVQAYGSVVASRVGKLDILAMNRILGFGLDQKIDPGRLEDLLDWYRQGGVPRVFFQLCPVASSEPLLGLLKSVGFRKHNNWVKLYRDTSPFHSAASDLTVRRVGPDQAQTFARIVTEAFGWPAELHDWLRGPMGLPGWYHYMAFDGDTPVATGASYLHDGLAWIDFAATLPEHRGRGAQSAILEARRRDSAEAGCRWMVVETAEDLPERDAPSFRNMIRHGFKIAYVRSNYVLEKIAA